VGQIQTFQAQRDAASTLVSTSRSISTANAIDARINTTETIVAHAMIEGRHSMAEFELK
jgi:hypothetical protein